ncbi:choice-of-anchor J domain-containing protein [Marinifilum fragile]|uniref:choice-of-anchor J domain-containing protein n=1 Tax=Marinifilum fragile TaxID=570161 RepID=UPI002AA87829|nr:choice-of-anchor J domain-containing protein [Marinifilum fragile]
MKKFIYMLSLLAIVFASCDPMEDTYDELDALDKVTFNPTQLEITLNADHYAAISKLALETAKNAEDTARAEEIASLLSFSDNRPASAYMPAVLNAIYQTLDETSSIKVNYNYDTRDLAYLTAYTGAPYFKLGEDQYAMVNELIAAAQYFSPSYPANDFLPEILAAKYPDAANGDVRLVSYDYRNVDPDPNEYSEVTLFSANYSDLSQFTTVSVTGDDQEWYDSGYGGVDYAKISGYSGGTRFENEDWLISPEIDLADVVDPFMNISQALNYLSGDWQQTFVYISDKYDATQAPDVADWTELTIENAPAGDSWTFVESGNIDLSAYEGKKIHVAFVYKSNATDAATWEISQLDVKGVTQGAEGEKVEEYYEFDGSEWAKSDVYYLQRNDYNEMGSGPGKYGNFSSSVPAEDYLPTFLSIKYPYAQEGDVMVMIYKYYSGGTKTIAAEYTYSEGAWSSMPVKMDQFVYYGSEGWKFDPTVKYTMASNDFQIIVNYSVDTHGKTSDYSDSEYYYGASSKYVNFDIRSGKFDSSFATWQDAVKEAIKTAYLPNKYPEAVAQVQGVDVYYILEFQTYDGSYTSYSIKFKCTKSGPNPEFEYVEGPTLK